MLNKLFRSRSGLQKEKKAAPEPIGDVVAQYEEKIRRGETPEPMLINRVGDVYRDLGRVDVAVRKYLEAAARYAENEAWTPAMQMARKAERLMRDRNVDIRPLRIETALVELRVALGRAEWLEATYAIDGLVSLLLPSDGAWIERLVELVDGEPTAPPEVGAALAKALTMLARPEMALDRLKYAHAQAVRLGHSAIAADLEQRIAQVEPSLETRSWRARMSTRVTASDSTPESFAEAGQSVAEAPTDSPRDAFESPGDFAIRANDAKEPGSASAGIESVQGDELLPPLDFVRDESTDSAREEISVDSGASSLDGPIGRPLPENLLAPQDEESIEDTLEIVPFEETDPSTAVPGSESRKLEEESTGLSPDVVGVQQPKTQPAESYISLESLRAKEDAPTSTRLVGQDARALASTEEEQVHELVRQFRDGIRQVVSVEDADTHYDLGLSFLQMGMYNEAVESLQLAIRSPGHRGRAIEALIEALLGRGDALLAYRAARTAREELEEPGQEALGLLYWQARAAEAMGRMTEASELYGEVCLRDVRFLDAHERLNRLEESA